MDPAPPVRHQCLNRRLVCVGHGGEFHPSPVFCDSLPFFSGACLFCEVYLNSGSLFLGCSCTASPRDASIGNTHARTHAHLQCPSTQPIHTLANIYRDGRSDVGARPPHRCHGGSFLPCQHFRIQAICPHLPPLLSPTLLFPFPQYFTFQERI